MAQLNPVAQSKLDSTSDSIDELRPLARNGNVNKDLPLAPDEIAGLREQKRQYTKELQAAALSQDKKRADIDPNHAYPTVELSTTLLLSEIALQDLLTDFRS